MIEYIVLAIIDAIAVYFFSKNFKKGKRLEAISHSCIAIGSIQAIIASIGRAGEIVAVKSYANMHIAVAMIATGFIIELATLEVNNYPFLPTVISTSISPLAYAF